MIAISVLPRNRKRQSRVICIGKITGCRHRCVIVAGQQVEIEGVDDAVVIEIAAAETAADAWATYMNNAALGKPTDRLWISFHSNASNGNGTTRGTLGLINTVPTQNCRCL